MTHITATAHRWSGGWELHLDGEPVTQAATLDHAAQQVRDYLDTVDPDVDHSGWGVDVLPDIGDLSAAVAASRHATEAAAEAAVAAARQSRIVAKRLRQEGYSVTDSAVILGVSRGRVSQLTAR